MGVNFILTLVFITISYINAQDYFILDEANINDWDTNEQNHIFPAQRDHVIHRRDVPETDLEGSGESDIPVPLLEEPLNKTSYPEDAAPPPDNPDEEKQPKGTDGIQISNFEETNPAVNAIETPKSNETKTEPDQLISADLQDVANKTVTKLDIKEEELTTTGPTIQTEQKNENQTEKIVNETTSQPENPEKIDNEAPVVIGSETEKVANETIVNPLEGPPIVINDETKLPPLIHSISNETTSQQAETTEAPIESAPQSTAAPLALEPDSPLVPKKEGATVISTSNNETKDSGKEEETKVTPQVLPSDLAEVEYVNKHKESESVNEQQSGNVIMSKVKSDGASQVEGSESEKALQGMAANAKISNEPTEQPATGESAKNVSRAGKDTTILVVLFVVVIAIGGAAFTHNYIKKRKQNAATNNDIVNGIRRSLQNLSSSNVKNNTDVEQGTELKPLMKENSPVTITKDYTDTKKEVQA